MALEIERKFLLKDDSWRNLVDHSFILKQGYLSTTPEATIRLRIKADTAMLTIKSKTIGIKRSEYEYAIPMHDAEEMLLLCKTPLIEKTRHTIDIGPHTWEIDEFYGQNEGLVIAEIELKSETDPFEVPDWLGEEVSDDIRYYNSNLTLHPYSEW